jgi:tRNA-dihydrouridine synthase
METFEQAVKLYCYGNTVQDIGLCNGAEIVACGVDKTTNEDNNNMLCYNGDIFTADDYKDFHKKYPTINKVMLGRGLIGNPFLAEEIKGISHDRDIKRFMAFHDELLSNYRSSDLGDNNTMFKMKELWNYMSSLFDEEEYGKELKRIKKSKNMEEYRIAVGKLI